MVLEVRVVAVLLRKLDEVALHSRGEREAAVLDVPEDCSVTGRLAGSHEGQESLAVNIGQNAAPCVVDQDNGGILLALFDGLSVCNVDPRMRRGVRPLQRHHVGNHVKAAESGLLCVKRGVDGL